MARNGGSSNGGWMVGEDLCALGEAVGKVLVDLDDG